MTVGESMLDVVGHTPVVRIVVIEPASTAGVEPCAVGAVNGDGAVWLSADGVALVFPSVVATAGAAGVGLVRGAGVGPLRCVVESCVGVPAAGPQTSSPSEGCVAC